MLQGGLQDRPPNAIILIIKSTKNGAPNFGNPHVAAATADSVGAKAWLRRPYGPVRLSTFLCMRSEVNARETIEKRQFAQNGL